MTDMRKPSISYAPRGVVRKQIALRLLAPELAKHETLASHHGLSSAAFARQVYLRGLRSYERAAPGRVAGVPHVSTACGVNNA